MKPTIKYIKANGQYYYPQVPGMPNLSKNFGNFPVCIIKRLSFNRWQIDYFDEQVHWERNNSSNMSDHHEDIPNQRVILYPGGVQEIRYNI